VLPAPADVVVEGCLDRVERALPGAVSGFSIEGSVALGGFRPGLSDIDFVATMMPSVRPGRREVVPRQ
jgi:hypothetical protein